MPEMISPNSITVRSLSGRSVEFVAGEPTYVVPEIVAEAEALGAIVGTELPEALVKEPAQ